MARDDSEKRAKPKRDRDRDAEPGEGLGGVVDEITSSWLFGDALSRLVDAGERVMHAQQSAFSAIGLPSGSQFESLTLRVRTLFHRIEELEDDIDRIERRMTNLENRVVEAIGDRGGASAKGGASSKSTASKSRGK
ncbi:MAG: hypothetical protein HY827_00925 [Actinobacteria bacterium]|nr:hypothetical protein [Actinomycetota bacterium]